MNDDNKRFVDFAQRLAKKINASAEQNLILPPALRHGNPSRLLGHNYKKMCKANNNCIFLSDEGAVLRKKLDNLSSRRYLFRAYPEVADAYAKLGFSWLAPDSFVPLVFLRIFAPHLGANEIDGFRSANKQEELRTELRTALGRVLEPIREMREYYANHEALLWNKLTEGTYEAIITAKSESERIKSALSA
jgi:tryptophanyl-tRNA synthetase